jgi:rhamnosyltransferase subunit B
MAESAPEFLFESVGSHGDVMPLLSIAGELVRRGHRCQLLANEHFRAEASARGVGFHSTTSRRTHVDTPGTFVSGMYDGFEGVHEYFGAPGAFDEHTVVVSTHALSSCEPPAEAHRLRTVRLILSPIRIRSLLAPPWPLGARAQGPDGERFLKVTLPAMRHAADRHPEVLARMNDVRARVGLPPVRTSAHEGDHVIAQAALFPDWFGMPAKDWPTMECVCHRPRRRGHRRLLRVCWRGSGDHRPPVRQARITCSGVEVHGAACECRRRLRSGSSPAIPLGQRKS